MKDYLITGIVTIAFPLAIIIAVGCGLTALRAADHRGGAPAPVWWRNRAVWANIIVLAMPLAVILVALIRPGDDPPGCEQLECLTWVDGFLILFLVGSLIGAFIAVAIQALARWSRRREDALPSSSDLMSGRGSG